VNVLSGLLMGLPVAWRRVYPLVVGPGMAVWVGIQEQLGGDLTKHSMAALVLLPLAMYSLGAMCERRRSTIGFGVALAGGFLSGVKSHDNLVDTLLFILLLLGGPWLVGRIVNARVKLAAELHEKTVRLEREQQQQAELAVAEERARIAREMHDVVAHSVSVMVVQASGARRTLERDPAKARAALASVESTGREALVEMRRMLGMLRRGDEDLALAPQPSINQLDSLVERAREAGLEVDVSVEGDRRRLQSSVDLSAFRIVQEALTNTIKHAGPARAKVTVRYGEHDVELDVVDDGREVHRRAHNGVGSGHGLVGMRERAAMLGGELNAGFRREGGFGVHARLPFTPTES
jgi:signal transduction histidine kinase